MLSVIVLDLGPVFSSEVKLFWLSLFCFSQCICDECCWCTPTELKHHMHQHLYCHAMVFERKIWGKVYLRSQILECPNNGEYWNISCVQVLLENVIFMFFGMCSVIQVLEHKNGLVLSSTHVLVSGTWSPLFPKIALQGAMYTISNFMCL